MAEAFYRLKGGGSTWTRVTGTPPITVTGLTEGAVYEFIKGDGTIGEVTAGVTTVAPTASTAPTITGTIQPGEVVTITEGTYSGTTPITVSGTLTLNGTDVSGDMTGSNYTIPASTAGQDLVWSEIASNGTPPNATQSVTQVVQSVPSGPITISGSFSGNTLVVDTSDPGTLYLVLVPDAEATPSDTQIIAGQRSDGSPAVYDYNAAVTSGNQNLSPDISAVADGTYKFCIVVDDAGTTSNVLTLIETIATPATVVDEGASTGTFTSSGGFRIWEGVPGDTLVVSSASDFNVLLVGDGGNGRYTMAGGSGGGEYVLREVGTNPLSLTAASYTVNKADNATDRGNDWTFATLTALGGGRGQNPSNLGTGDGGSGGGASGNVGTPTPGASIALDGIGFDGGPANGNGTRGGGGGSPLGTPPAAASNEAGNGFDGIPSPVPGESGVRYGAGGGAGSSTDATRGLGGLGGGGDGGGDVTLATAGQNGRGAGGGGAGGTGAGGPGGTGTIKVWWPE